MGVKGTTAMKHHNFIVQQNLPSTKEEIKPLIDQLVNGLSERGIKATFSFSPSEAPVYGCGLIFDLAKPIVGRDWKKSRIECWGFRVFVYKSIGRDQKTDKNGYFVWDKEANRPAVKGKPYQQYSAKFCFYGNETRFRCRHKECIQDGTMKVYDYGDSVKEMDFLRNLDYLANIR
jgi:hypothetical protein